jgi:hypothetical protein
MTSETSKHNEAMPWEVDDLPLRKAGVYFPFPWLSVLLQHNTPKLNNIFIWLSNV